MLAGAGGGQRGGLGSVRAGGSDLGVEVGVSVVELVAGRVAGAGFGV